MSGPETRIRQRILMALRTQYPQGYFRKIHGNAYQHVGIPDIIGCIEGFFVGLEVKTDAGKSTVVQILEGKDIERAGGIHAVVRSPEETLDLLKNLPHLRKGRLG